MKTDNLLLLAIMGGGFWYLMKQQQAPAPVGGGTNTIPGGTTTTTTPPTGINQNTAGGIQDPGGTPAQNYNPPTNNTAGQGVQTSTGTYVAPPPTTTTTPTSGSTGGNVPVKPPVNLDNTERGTTGDGGAGDLQAYTDRLAQCMAPADTFSSAYPADWVCLMGASYPVQYLPTPNQMLLLLGSSLNVPIYYGQFQGMVAPIIQANMYGVAWQPALRGLGAMPTSRWIV